MQSNPRTPRPHVLALALAGALATGAVLAETGTVLKDSPVLKEPMGSAEVLAQLSARETVEITARQGAWAGVTTPAGVAGWTRVLNLRTGSGLPGNDGGGSLVAAFRTGSSSNAVSTGVKGLSADQLMNASANTAEVALLDSFAANPGQAQQFAAQAPLSAQKVNYLEEGRGGRRRQR
ncbi:hypothetical protein [Arenimonas terrae]|uniref:SH3 domain-containing protein n=1 Tax=Arenimonas terrae TaxID=2546226 RepID=A0A5C4RT97_9GAMM|nr:hypothetical protein [Arenimonas terrae]TNJ34553.1 hypothetical protein E1B00_01840 [Arenimonas terrae]